MPIIKSAIERVKTNEKATFLGNISFPFGRRNGNRSRLRRGVHFLSLAFAAEVDRRNIFAYSVHGVRVLRGAYGKLAALYNIRVQAGERRKAVALEKIVCDFYDNRRYRSRNNSARNVFRRKFSARNNAFLVNDLFRRVLDVVDK